MKKRTILLSVSAIIFILFVSFLFSVTLNGSANSSEYFEVSEDTLVRYTGDASMITIPSGIKIIGESAFEGNETLKKVIISKGVECIDFNAFGGCTALLEVEISDSVNLIKSSAFAQCTKLTDVSVGKGLSELGSGVFAGCESLSDIEIAEKNPYFTCIDGVLYNADRTFVYQLLSGRNKPYYIMPDSVLEIGQYAFWGNSFLKHMSFSDSLDNIPAFGVSNVSSLETVTMSFNTKEINMKAFEDCISLRQIYIPDSVKFIHDTAFDGCSQLEIYATYYSKAASYAKEHNINLLTYAKYPLNQAELAKEEYYLVQEKEKELQELLEEESYKEALAESEKDLIAKTSLVNDKAVVIMDRYDTTVHGGTAVLQRDELEKNINDGKIADQAFYMRSDLEEISLPDSIEKIGRFSFARSGLQKITIPENVKVIEYGAFYHCDELIEVNIPSSVTKIEKNVFAHTPWLENWFESGTEDYLIVGDGILLAYKCDDSEFVCPSNVKYFACEIP